MKSMRMALLAAAALAIVPAAAHADVRERGDRERPSRDGGDHPRPAPPQAQSRGSGMMVMPRAPDAGRPNPPQVQMQSQDRGSWQGGWRGPGGQGRGDVRIERPIPSPAPALDTGAARAQWRQQQDRGGAPQNPAGGNDDRRWDNRGQWNGGDRHAGNNDDRNGDHRWDRGRNQWDGNDHRSGNDDGRDRDHRWDRGNDRGDHRWEGGRDRGDNRWGGRTDRRWDPGRWRNDNRYDWRDWRNSHRDLFSRHYRAPRGYHYRSVYAGFFLEPFFYSSSYWLNDPFDYRLPPVPWPLQWVHYYNDALLVDVTTGEVVDVIPNFFF